MQLQCKTQLALVQKHCDYGSYKQRLILFWCFKYCKRVATGKVTFQNDKQVLVKLQTNKVLSFSELHIVAFSMYEKIQQKHFQILYKAELVSGHYKWLFHLCIHIPGRTPASCYLVRLSHVSPPRPQAPSTSAPVTMTIKKKKSP